VPLAAKREMTENQLMPSAKDAARRIIEHLPDQATWDDIMYELYVKQKIEEGLADIEAGGTIPHEEIKAELLGRGD
jgi:predicted transcriptional regulator